MKNKKLPVKDFFEGYHRARVFQYILPGFFGVFLALGLITMSHTGDMRGLMASVSQVAAPSYDADIVMERKGDTVQLILGKDAQHVDTLSMRFLTDPTEKLQFIPENGTVTDETEGAYFFVRSFGGADVPAGTVIASFTHIPEGARMALTDTEFVSEGVRYSLTNKGE